MQRAKRFPTDALRQRQRIAGKRRVLAAGHVLVQLADERAIEAVVALHTHLGGNVIQHVAHQPPLRLDAQPCRQRVQLAAEADLLAGDGVLRKNRRQSFSVCHRGCPPSIRPLFPHNELFQPIAHGVHQVVEVVNGAI